MESTFALEKEVKTLQRGMAGMLKMFKELKKAVEVIEKKLLLTKDDEIKEIIDTQKVIEGVIVANGDAIKRIDEEIKELTKKTDVIIQTEEAVGSSSREETREGYDVSSRVTKRKRCRYYNRGYCKYELKCRFIHPTEICKEHMQSKKCININCGGRHPKRCKWLEKEQGCRRSNCDYLHVTLASEHGYKYSCAGCKDIWTDVTSVKRHVIENTEVCFCLNCDEWIQYKDKVFDQGWTLLDEEGFLRQGI